MFIKNLDIVNFRNYEKLSIEFDKNINIIYGNNAQGKTNLLESIYFLGITKSHRVFIDDSLIKNGEEFCRLNCIINNNNIETNFKIILSSKFKKVFIDNFQYKKISDYISKLKVIIFFPEDLNLIKGNPLLRRRFLNLELGQFENSYLNILNDYNKLIKLKNNYLKNFTVFDNNYYDILNNSIIDKSVLIYFMRKKFIDKINCYCSKIYKDLCGIEGFYIKYKSSIEFNTLNRNEIKEILVNEFSSVKEKEIKYKRNLLGPSFDDFEFYIDDLNLKKYGSQGQQRLAVLALKLSEVEIFKDVLNISPILLLDDVFSELDNYKKNSLLSYIDSSVQTIITTTDLDFIDSRLVEKAKLIYIENGKIL